MTEASTAGHFADKQSRDLLFGMEADLREVADLATALAMAISGMGKMASNPGEEQDALQQVADEVRFGSHKLFDTWKKAHELSHADSA
jgi:hypothetical protein